MGVIFQKLHLLIRLSIEWRVLADRKIAHLIALGESERWGCYYSHEQFFLALDDAKRLKGKWDKIVREEISIASEQSLPQQQVENQGLGERLALSGSTHGTKRWTPRSLFFVRCWATADSQVQSSRSGAPRVTSAMLGTRVAAAYLDLDSSSAESMIGDILTSEIARPVVASANVMLHVFGSPWVGSTTI